MIDKATLIRFMEEIAQTDEPLRNDLESWQISEEDFREIMESSARMSFMRIPFDGPKVALTSLFFLAFSLGVKVTLENEMQRMLDSK